MAVQIKVDMETKAGLDHLDKAHWVPLKTYGHKVAFLLWFYNTHKQILNQKHNEIN